jgi:tRNA threonylcarbamoyl adenosine modification protein YeaZ/ribosomal-protein-alanine acetyltransferase
MNRKLRSQRYASQHYNLAMPSVLAIETSSQVGAVCVLRNGVATQEVVRDDTKLSAWVVPAIDRVLKRANLALDEIDAFAYGAGPGAFTGVRTACATAQALAYARAKPLHAVGSLFGLARSAIDVIAPLNKPYDSILIIIDARLNEVFLLKSHRHTGVELKSSDTVALQPMADTHFDTNTLVVGSGAIAIAKRDGFAAARIDAISTLTFDAEKGWAEAIARIAAKRIARGEPAIDPRDAQPHYVRDNVAKTEAERTRGRSRMSALSGARISALSFTSAEIALMREHDLDEVVDVERRSNPHPWTREHFEDALRSGYLCLAAREGDALVGFAVARTLVDDAELLLIAVRPEHRRGGCATLLVNALLVRLREMGKTPLHLEVRASNASAIAFYEARGFARTGQRKNYYPNGVFGTDREDALLMAREIAP